MIAFSGQLSAISYQQERKQMCCLRYPLSNIIERITGFSFLLKADS
jgi:hypothetical protein